MTDTNIPAGTPASATGASTFAELGITGQLARTAEAAGMKTPKPIQVLSIPPHLEGRDILGIAQTGSGKTAAFALPILARIAGLGNSRHPKGARALVLAPTRELAVQIETTFRTLARGAHLSTALVLGGVSRSSQVRKLRPGVDVLVATPGRLTDLMNTGELDLSATRWLVIDEADRMLDMGFIRDVRRIAGAVHRKRQTALFSATMPREVASLAESLLQDPVRVETARAGTAAGEIDQKLILARTAQKRRLLSVLLADKAIGSALVFSRTKHGAERIGRDLERDGFAVGIIHGNKSQNARQRALNDFRDGSLPILVATDIVARGIDVPGITHVINFDLPDEAESYIHRIGRTGRNGASGTAVTFCDPSENAKLRAVEKLVGSRIAVSEDHLGAPDPVRAKPAANERNRSGPAAERERKPGRTRPAKTGQRRQRSGENRAVRRAA